MANVGYCPKFRAFTATGEVGAGYLLYFYDAGTSTPKAVYTAYDRLTAATDANGLITLDSAGETTFFWGSGRYKVVLKTAAGATVWTVDYINGDGPYIDTSVTPNVLKYYDGSAYVSSSPIYANSDLNGCVLSNNGSDTEHDIDISAGHRCDSTGAYNMVLSSTLTKKIDAAWTAGTNQGGLDTGAVGASTSYHVWLIKNLTSGVVDALFSLSATAPTMPTGYTVKRRLGCVLTNSSSNILAFYQYLTHFYLDAWILGTNSVPTASATTTLTLSAPLGLYTRVFLSCSGQGAAAATSIISYLLAANNACAILETEAAGYDASNMFWALTNTAAQVQITANANAMQSFSLVIHGWDDYQLINAA